MSHLRMFGSPVQAFHPPQEREGKVADRTRTGRYVGHYDSGRTHHYWRGTNRLFKRSRAEVSLEKHCFIHHFVSKPEPFLDSIHEDNYAKLNAHTAWHIEKDNDTVSMMKVKTTKFTVGCMDDCTILEIIETNNITSICLRVLVMFSGCAIYGLWQRESCS